MVIHPRMCKATVLAFLLLLTGCASLRPQLAPDATVSSAYNNSPTLPNAVKLAESLKTQYSAKVETSLYTERVNGLLLIGMGALGANLAMRSVGANELLGLGLAGAAVYTGTQWGYGKPEQYIYAVGANAIQCALDAMQPMSRAYGRRARLSDLAGQIEASASSLQQKLAPFEAAAPLTVTVLKSRAVVEQAQRVAPLARDAVQALDDAGPELRSSISAIQLQVTNAVIANSPNLQALMQSLGSTLPSIGGRIVGVSFPAIPAPGGAKSSGLDASLDAPTQQLEALIAEAEKIIAEVRAKPSLEKLKNCSVDLKQAGLTLRVLPAGDVAVLAGSSGSTVVMSGGVTPYLQPTWVGARPPVDKIEFKFNAVSGAVTIEAKKEAPAGTYPLLLSDSGQGRETVLVVVKAAPSVPDTSSPTSASPTTVKGSTVLAKPCPIDPKVQKLQQALIDKNIKTVKVGDKDKTLSADGCMGEITQAAMTQYYKSQVVGGTAADNAVPPAKELFDFVAKSLNI